MKNFRFWILDCGLKARLRADARRRFQIQNPPTRKRVPRIRKGFSLTEVLIVIALIVLILAMALPAFNFITGGRSVDAATNQVSAMLSRARTEALGLQEIRGVMFYIDPVTNREMMTLVKESPSKGSFDNDPSTGTNPDVDVWLDVNSDEDHIPMPKGIGIQVTNDDTNIALQPDRYIGFNVNTVQNTIPIGGVILFDGYGRLANKHYGFRMTNVNAQHGAPSGMAQLLIPTVMNNTTPDATDFCQLAKPNAPLSSFGFVLFEEDLMKDKFGEGYASDPTYSGANYTTESGEEKWLDENATAVLINRYNGTLVRGD
ncbi:MAG TPA: prepilin-type N-terminal cleavage/methylation domain-containing protein [Tepidisphaeraceae bacterium]|jgi:prepilin-type N-terminal cleavage/methylation domain-containing protein|nr:prepilin-type N-terminal cleavage/methylation domain-containing protein [Tepidisphaeraceae bacterium]